MEDFSQRFDGVINIITAIAVIFYAVFMNGSEKNSGRRKRLLFLFSLLGSLCLFRGINYIFDFGHQFEVTILMISALIPLSLFLLVELLLRRHLPQYLKIFVSIASISNMIMFLLFGVNNYVMYVLLINYILTLFSLGIVLLMSKSLDLQKTEYRLIRLVSFISLLVIPLIVTDFKKLVGLDTVRLGAFGILFFLYSLIRVWETVQIAGGIKRLAWLLGFNIAAAAIFCFLFDLFQVYFYVFIIFIMLRMFADILIYAKDSYNKKAQDLALHVVEVFLKGNLKLDEIKKNIALDEFYLVSRKDLQYYSPERIVQCFKTSGLYFKNETYHLTKDRDEREEILHLFEDVDCNACIYVEVEEKNFYLILFKWPDLAPKNKLQKEIHLIQGLASQIKE